MVDREELIDMVDDLADYAEEEGDVTLAYLLRAIGGAYDIGRMGGFTRHVQKFINKELTDSEAREN